MTANTERPIIFTGPMVRAILEGRKTQTRRVFTPPPPFAQGDDIAVELATGSIRPPFSIGDRLWVRETWQTPALCPVQYRATSTERIGHWNPALGPWRSPIHMPRRLSRLTLTVIAVKVERLQEITEEEAIAEGVETERCCGVPSREFGPGDWGNACCGQPDSLDPVAEFRDLWDSIHGPGAWAANPWVATITFCREDRP